MLNAFQVDLIKAIENGSLEDIRKLVIGKYDIDKPLIPLHEVHVNPRSTRVPFPTIRGPTPLVLAILYEETQIIEYFVNTKKASLETAVGGMFPIHYACIIGNTDVLNIIVSAKRETVNKINSFDYTPLHLAAANNNVKAVLFLLQKGAEVNPKRLPDSGNTPLHVCMRSKDTVIAEALISKGALTEARNKLEETPIETAKNYNNSEMVKFLTSYTQNTYIVRPFDELCKAYLDSNSALQTDIVKELYAKIEELSNKVNELEKKH